jgi:hypothetical protein
MPRTYLPASETERKGWLNNFALKLEEYGLKLGLDNDDIVSIKKDAAYYDYTVTKIDVLDSKILELKKYKEILSDDESSSTLGDFPKAIAFDSIPEAVKPGIFDRVSALVKRIKSSKGYTESLGQDLRIIITPDSKNDQQSKPVIKIVLVSGKPVISFTKGSYSGADIYVDRADGKGYILLGTSMEPKFTDETKLGDSEKAVLWTYKAIYKKGNMQVGDFSDPISIAVSKQI